MVAIDADSRSVERCIEELLVLSRAAGATFSDDMVLRCMKGNLSVAASAGGGALMSIPGPGLVFLDQFQFSLADDELSILSCASNMRPDQIRTAEAMLELYNLTGKAITHRQTSSWLFIAGQPELARFVQQGRDGPSVRALMERVMAGDISGLALDTFLKSRTITTRGGRVGLMPVVDFINHDFQASPFYFPEESAGGGVAVRKSRLSGNRPPDECFVCYGPYDSFDTWLTYSFVDMRAPILRSVPLEINLDEKVKIRVHAHMQASRHGSLPPELEDLRIYLPDILSRTEDGIDISFLMIPGRMAPRALRRVLEVVISIIKPGHPHLQDLVLQAESQVIGKNVEYYTAFRDMLQNLVPADPLKKTVLNDLLDLCARQISHIDDYNLISVMSQ